MVINVSRIINVLSWTSIGQLYSDMEKENSIIKRIASAFLLLYTGLAFASDSVISAPNVAPVTSNASASTFTFTNLIGKTASCQLIHQAMVANVLQDATTTVNAVVDASGVPQITIYEEVDTIGTTNSGTFAYRTISYASGVETSLEELMIISSFTNNTCSSIWN